MKQQHGGITTIFWGPHSRHTEDAAQKLGGSYHAIHYFNSSWRKASYVVPIKYVMQALKTWAVLLKERPSAVYVIITPTFSALAVYLYCLFARIPFVMDVHGHSLESKKWAWTIPLQRFLSRRAVATVIDQQKYQQIFSGWGAQTIMLERAPVEVPESVLKLANEETDFNILLISIFAEDEPVDIVIEAARQLPDVRFYITGDTKRADPQMITQSPANVTFTGYLRGDEYWKRLVSANAVMTLTTEPHSLVSGGVESMAVGKPTILSRTPVLTAYFTKGTVFVEHTVESIVAGVRTTQANNAQLIEEISALAIEKRNRWHREHARMRQLIAQRSRTTMTPATSSDDV